MRRTAVFAAVLFMAGAAFAAALPREFVVKPEPIKEAPPYLTQVVVPEANCAAVSDASALLVVGRRAADGKQLAVFHLDAAGQPSGEPAWIALPKPEILAAKASYPLGVLFHPRLPLLYVWQDIEAPPGKPENLKFAEYQEFDHLLVYAIKDGVLDLVQSGARGSGFRCGFSAGTVGLDFGAKNLFVPNAAGETWDEAGIAFFALDEEGLPDETPEENRPAAKPVKNLTISKSKKLNRPVILPKKLRTNHYYPSGTGWFAGREALIMGGVSGCMMADAHNGGLRQVWYGLPELTGSCAIAGHPRLPALYMALQDGNRLFQIAQVNGYVTLQPQIATVTGTHLNGTPVVLAKQARLAVTEAKSIHFFGLQADGKLDGQDQQFVVAAGVGKEMAYSERSGRLYVAVAKAN